MYMATQDDIERVKKIILDIINKRINMNETELQQMVEKIMNISYSIGGGYDEGTIRQLAQVKLREWYNLY